MGFVLAVCVVVVASALLLAVGGFAGGETAAVAGALALAAWTLGPLAALCSGDRRWRGARSARRVPSTFFEKDKLF